MTPAPKTYQRWNFSTEAVVKAKGSRRVSVIIPARNEEATVADVVTAVAEPHVASRGGSGLVDEILVVNDASTDATGTAAANAGARVIHRASSQGKGSAMEAGVEAATGDLVIFLDADVLNTRPDYISSLLGPLVNDDSIALVKGFYERPLHDAPTGGGRVTELLARPIIDLAFPALSAIRQPLAGETAAPREVLRKFTFATGYGVEIGLLIDVASAFGVDCIAQVDLGVRVHRNRPMSELRPMATEVLAAALERQHLNLRDGQERG
jgi:glucosyl-3-phosphoglycerate synthase